MPFGKIMKTVKKVANTVKNVAAPASRGTASRGMAGKIAEKISAAKPPAASPDRARGLAGKIVKKIGGMKFKDGGMADKTGRAMKKTDADAKGRAMSKKAPKKMMGGGMMKGYAGGGDVTCGKATRGYGAARKGK